MKTPEEWSVWIVAYMQKHPVTSMAAAQAQIKYFAGLIQEDAAPPTDIQTSGNA